MNKQSLHDYFYIKTSQNFMIAYIYCTSAYDPMKMTLDERTIKNFLKENDITYGVDERAVKLLANNISAHDFPLTIAKGTPPKHGEDGYLIYEVDLSSSIKKTKDWNFRDIMRIPSVKKGEKLATVVSPTAGIDGMNVYGQTVPAQQGHPSEMVAGKNVVYHNDHQAFYAIIEGQISINGHSIDVQPVYEVKESLSMKTGNLDFVGSIIIHGDVPTGYTVKAEGDVKIYGIVEGATVIAGGSIFISEGLAGLQKGHIEAANNIHLGYINQGFAQAGQSIHVENSIVHSTCTARDHIFCQLGNIIGGSLSAGISIEAKDVGNRLHTKTNISLGADETLLSKEETLRQQKEELQQTLKQLNTIGTKLRKKQYENNPNIQKMLSRQQKSLEKTSAALEKVDEQLQQINASAMQETQAKLLVRRYLYPNVVITFGRYSRTTKTTYQNIQVRLKKHAIDVAPL